MIDKALLRPGRIDCHIFCDLPTNLEREDYFRRKLKRLRPGEEMDIQSLVEGSEGFSYADLESIWKEVAEFTEEKLGEALRAVRPISQSKDFQR